MTGALPASTGASPVQLDHRRALGVRRQVAGRSRGCVVVRGGVHRGRPGPEADGVPRPDPVVAGRARGETRVPVRGLDRGLRRTPAYTGVRGHGNLVVGDWIATVRGRRVPVEVDDGGPGGGRRQIAGYARYPYPGRCRGGVRVRRRPEGAVGVQRPDLVVAGGAYRETRMLVLGRDRIRQQRKADADIRRHVHPVTADRVPAGRGRCVPVEVDDGRPGGDRRQIAGCTRCPRPRAPRCGARDHVRGVPRPLGVGRGDAIVQGGAWIATAIRVAVGHASADTDPARVAVGGRLDPVAGDITPAVRGRSLPTEEDGCGAEGFRRQVLRRRRCRVLHRSRDGGRWGRHPPRGGGGDHEKAGRSAQSVPNHPAASLCGGKDVCASVCESISMGWQDLRAP